MKTIVILNDNRARREHWDMLLAEAVESGKCVVESFSHPNYLVETLREKTTCIEDSPESLFVVDAIYTAKNCLYSEAMTTIKSAFPKAKFVVSSGLYDEGKSVAGYDTSIGPEPVTYEVLMNKVLTK